MKKNHDQAMNKAWAKFLEYLPKLLQMLSELVNDIKVDTEISGFLCTMNSTRPKKISVCC